MHTYIHTYIQHLALYHLHTWPKHTLTGPIGCSILMHIHIHFHPSPSPSSSQGVASPTMSYVAARMCGSMNNELDGFRRILLKRCVGQSLLQCSQVTVCLQFYSIYYAVCTLLITLCQLLSVCPVVLYEAICVFDRVLLLTTLGGKLNGLISGVESDALALSRALFCEITVLCILCILLCI